MSAPRLPRPGERPPAESAPAAACLFRHACLRLKVGINASLNPKPYWSHSQNKPPALPVLKQAWNSVWQGWPEIEAGFSAMLLTARRLNGLSATWPFLWRVLAVLAGT